MRKKTAWGILLTGPLLLALGGCGGDDVSAGSEGSAINLGRCFGADCGANPQAVTAGEDVAEPCGEHEGVLEEPRVAPAPDFYDLDQLAVAPDGSIWVVGLLGGHHTVALVRYSAEGELLGKTDIIVKAGEHESLTQELGVDASGNAWLAVYSVESTNADEDPTERLTLYTYDSSLEQVGVPQVFRGMADAEITATTSGTFVLAGDALGDGAHGVLARVSQGEPEWIQTNVPSSGARAGVGVTSMALVGDGRVGVLAQRSPRWNGGPDIYEYGLTTFDRDGQPLWDLRLPTAYTGGSRAEVEALPNGDFVVAGSVGDHGLLVRRVSATGRLGWGFQLQGYEAELSIDAGGRAIAPSLGGVAVVSADGERCTQRSYPQSDEYYAIPRDVAVSGEYLFMATQYDLLRYRLPSE